MAPTVELIENNNVAVHTKQRYNSTIFGFVMWLYNHRDRYEGYLRGEVVEQIQSVLFDTSIEMKKWKKNCSGQWWRGGVKNVLTDTREISHRYGKGLH